MSKTNYIWDEVNDTYLMETDENGTATVVYSQEPSQYGGVLSQRRGVLTSFYHADHLGSTTMLTEAGAGTDTYEYDAWGNEIARVGTTETPFRWIGAVGYYFDATLQSYYVRARIYLPRVSAWNTTDPLGPLDSFVPYGYVRRRPSVLIDPSRLFGATGTVPPIGGNIPLDNACALPKTTHSKLNTPADTPHITFQNVTDGDKKAIDDRYGRRKGQYRGFIQRVVITITASAGECKGLNCTSNSSGTCTMHSFSRTIEFTETFTAGNTAKDRQPLLFDKGWFSAIQRTCKVSITNCCAWIYQLTRIKTVTYGIVPKATPAAYNIADSATVTCAGSTAAQDAGQMPRWDSMPIGGGKKMDGNVPDFEGGVVFPADPPVRPLESTMEYTIRHAQCGSAIAITGQFRPYVAPPEDA